MAKNIKNTKSPKNTKEEVDVSGSDFKEIMALDTLVKKISAQSKAASEESVRNFIAVFTEEFFALKSSKRPNTKEGLQEYMLAVLEENKVKVTGEKLTKKTMSANTVKRITNYNLFVQEYPEVPKGTNRMKVAAAAWKKLSEVEKAEYKDRAAVINTANGIVPSPKGKKSPVKAPKPAKVAHKVEAREEVSDVEEEAEDKAREREMRRYEDEIEKIVGAPIRRITKAESTEEMEPEADVPDVAEAEAEVDNVEVSSIEESEEEKPVAAEAEESSAEEEPEEVDPKCTEILKNGNRCKRDAKVGKYCTAHSKNH